MKKKSIAILLGIVMIFAGLMVLSSIEKAQASPVQLVSSQPEFEWSKTYGGSGRDTAYSVIQTRDGGYALFKKFIVISAGYFTAIFNYICHFL